MIDSVTEAINAKQAWESAAFDLHRSKAAYDYAERRLILARDQLLMRAVRGEIFFDDDLARELQPVEYLGLSIKQAAQKALYALKSANADRLVEFMQQRGFQFQPTGVPVRELHGALVKQPWAYRNPATNEWEYVIQ